MKRIFCILLLFVLGLNAQDVGVVKDKWGLAGSLYDVNVGDLNLKDGDILWKYDGSWKYYKKGLSSSNLLSIKSGEGFWIKSLVDYTLTIPKGTKSETSLKSGWNLISPDASDINLADSDRYKSVIYAWSYEGGNWKYWIRDGEKQFDTIHVGSGAWVYNGYAMAVGDTKTALKGGTFEKVYKSSSDSVEDIWNISFRVKVKDISNFSIGIKFLKKSSGAIGEFVYTGLKISDGKISSPSFVYMKGTKGNGDSSSTHYDDSYDPQKIRVNSVELNGDILTLRIGTIMKKQTIASESTFKARSDYNITIVPENLEIVGGSQKELKDLVDFNHIFSGVGISGDIEIQ